MYRLIKLLNGKYKIWYCYQDGHEIEEYDTLADATEQLILAAKIMNNEMITVKDFIFMEEYNEMVTKWREVK